METSDRLANSAKIAEESENVCLEFCKIGNIFSFISVHYYTLI